MSRRRPRVATLVGSGVLALVAGAAVAAAWPGGAPDGSGSGQGGAGSASVSDGRPPETDHGALVQSMEKASPGELGGSRLAPGLVPPTNRWFSGLALGPEPQPVFPLPLSVSVAGGVLAVGAPEPVASEAAVVGPHVPSVTLDVGADEARVSAYDAASVTVELLAAGDVLATAVLAQGSPFVSVVAVRDVDVRLSVVFDGSGTADEPATATATGRRWGLVASGLDGGRAGLVAGEHLSLYPLPDDADEATLAALSSAAADPLVGTDLRWGVGDDLVRTTLDYRTRDGGAGVVVALPHHDREGCDLGTYPSVHGTLVLCTGAQVVGSAPALEPAATLDLGGLGAEERERLAGLLAADVTATGAFAADTYFGGKDLYRAAQLVALGRALGADDVVASLADRVAQDLRTWADPTGCVERGARCFVYDEVARGVVGLTPSFGSEQFNDHHFHYGYLLSAAGLLAADDPELAADVAPVMDALAADVAAGTASEWFPQLRVFDAYRGHSWASGTAPFADGNNQESTSEAFSAWNGLALWAQATGQADLAAQARWLLSTEAAAARTYWTEPDLDDPSLDGFDHRVLALVWGAKRDWATWFSAEPSAMLGIQLIPMPPVDGAYARDADQVRAAVAEAAPDGFDVQFGDYLLMYLALVDPEAARAAAADLPDDVIDGATSRTYLEAWLAAPPSAATVGP